MKNKQERKGNWRWAAVAVLTAVLAACAPAPSQRAAAPAAPAAPAATALPPDTAAEATQAEAPAATEASAATPTAAPLIQTPEAAAAANDAQATQDRSRIAPTPSALSTPLPTLSPPAAVPPPAPAIEPGPTAAPQIPSLTPAPLPTEPALPTANATLPSGAGGGISTEVAPSLTPIAPSTTPAATAVMTEAASSAMVMATETPVAESESLSVTKALTPTLAAPPATVAQAITTETRIVELEWPPEMRLGDTDIVRVALVPSVSGYTVTTEFPGNTTVTRTVEVDRPANYDVFAVGRLDGAGFAISPAAEEPKALLPGQLVDWRWSIEPRAAGQHRLALVIKLRWVPAGMPAGDSAGPVQEADLFTKGMTVQVTSLMGMSTAQASSTGLVGLLIGSGLGLFGLAFRRAPQMKATLAQVINPNASLKIETHAAMQLADDETALLRTLFARYDRIVIENEFRSGYSGARTFLVHPIHADGRADAFTIAKMGSRASIQREFDNYQRFVKDTLPPITARIQEPPVTAPALFNRDDKAVLRYTFIGEQGRMPVSLREALLAERDGKNGGLINKLFETFGPNWWMQRKPFVFRLAQEYDRMLPAHYVIEPVEANAASGAKLMDGRKPAEQDTYRIGDIVVLQHFPAIGIEMRADGRSLSLRGEAVAGQAPLRVRWASIESASQPRKFANGVFGRVVGTRETLLRELTAGADLQGLADPIGKLARLLNERVQGTQSTIHGDLNLENGLVGPGGFVWLIDFAETRDGHALYDFAHLEAEIIAHVIAPAEPDSAVFVAQLRAGAYPLLEAVHQIAAKCLFNPSQMREYWLALGVTCLGATKYGNLSAHQQHLLFLTAAYLFEML